jgi:polysaccharide biosynthesis protein PslH
MKLLFISSRDVYSKLQGAPQCTNRNYRSFCELLGDRSVHVINLNSDEDKYLKFKILKWFNLLFGYYWGLSKKKILKIWEASKDSDIVFIDSSFYGIIASYLRKQNFKGKIICHFHNAEFILRFQKLRQNPLRFWELLLVFINEKKAFKNSDTIVVLNERDSDVLQKAYGQRKVFIIPISLEDVLIKIENKAISSPPILLFFGSDHSANFHGIKWFIRNVLSNVDIKLQIAGKGMELLKNELLNSKIEVYGFVPDLSELIQNADFIISPVFRGSGMKVKICEALMYGKNIIGTTESFEGYEIDRDKVGAICNNKKEFIDTINGISSNFKHKFNEYNRQCYEEKYSFTATLVKFAELIN